MPGPKAPSNSKSGDMSASDEERWRLLTVGALVLLGSDSSVCRGEHNLAQGLRLIPLSTLSVSTGARRLP